MKTILVPPVVAAVLLSFLGGVKQAAGTIISGSEAIKRPYLDEATGQVYIYAGGTFEAGDRMGTFTFFDSSASPGYITPILFQQPSPGVYDVVGLGTSRTVMGFAQPQSFEFILKVGIDLTMDDTFTFGYINALLDNNGAITAESTGTVDMTLTDGVTPGPGLGGDGTSNRWVFTPYNRPVTVALGTSFGVPGTSGATFDLNDPTVNPYLWANLDRTYSANLEGASAVPEPSTLAMFAGLGAIGLIATWRKRPLAQPRSRRN